MNTSRECSQGERLNELIFVIRDKKVIVDSDLANLCGVSVKALNKRSSDLTDPEFRFSLVEAEKATLSDRCFRFRKLKRATQVVYAYTETGAILSALLSKPDIAFRAMGELVSSFVSANADEDQGQKFEAFRKLITAIQDGTSERPRK